MTYGNITKEDLEKLVSDVFNRPSKLILRNAHFEMKVDGNLVFFHKVEDCEYCRNFHKLLEEEFKQQLKNYEYN